MLYTLGFYYEGIWKNDHKNGRGRLIDENGHYYEGNWKNNEPNGFGIYVSKNPYWRYEGDWQDGVQDGKGK